MYIPFNLNSLVFSDRFAWYCAWFMSMANEVLPFVHAESFSARKRFFFEKIKNWRETRIHVMMKVKYFADVTWFKMKICIYITKIQLWFLFLEVDTIYHILLLLQIYVVWVTHYLIHVHHERIYTCVSFLLWRNSSSAYIKMCHVLVASDSEMKLSKFCGLKQAQLAKERCAWDCTNAKKNISRRLLLSLICPIYISFPIVKHLKWSNE